MSYLNMSMNQPANTSSNNALGHTSLVENLIRQADRDLHQYHHLIQQYRQELETMKNKIEYNNNQILDTTRPLIDFLNGFLANSMINQKEQNSNFQDQLTQLKKQKSIINQMIVATSKRTEQLNQQVGFY